VYVVAVGEGTLQRAFTIAEELRDRMPGVRIEVNLGGGSFKSQMKRADKSQATFALVLGEQELAQEQIGLKPLRGDEAQSSIALTDLAATLEQRLIKAD
jgi:histidyl-tRNA synthetase